MSNMATIVQVSVSNGGVPKLPVMEALVAENGIVGDGHDQSPAIHGGPERALCLYSLERIEALAAEGHPIFAGATGENVTLRGLDWDAIVPGVQLRLGAGVLVEVTRYTTPCSTNARWFTRGDINRMHQNLHPGWSRVYARVLTGGTIRPGDGAEVVVA